MIDLERAVPSLHGTQDIKVLSHHFPDGDTLGCVAALCRALQLMGKRACCTHVNPVPEKYDFLFGGIERQEFLAKLVISVDMTDIKLLGPVLAMKHAGKIDPCIDHHGSHQDFAENSYVDSIAVTACEIIHEAICRLSAVPDQAIAQVVYTGIAMDTGCFRYPNTTARIHEIAAQVTCTGTDAGDINRRMFETKTHARLEMERSVLDSTAFYFDACCAAICIGRTVIETPGADKGDLNGPSATPRQTEGVLVGVTMRERKTGGYKVSLRTQPQVNAAKICAELSGGDHVATAGCITEEDFESVREKLLAAIGKVLEAM